MDKEKRKKANADLIERMRRGEPLNTVPTSATWFPPRPLTIKSKKDIERLYGITGGVINETTEESKSDS